MIGKLFTVFLFLFAQAPGAATAAPQPTAAEEFGRLAFDSLPIEQPYEYHQKLKSGPVHEFRRDMTGKALPKEMPIPDQGWGLVVQSDSGPLLQLAAEDFQDYLKTSMKADVVLERDALLQDWNQRKQHIVVGTRQQLGGCGKDLKAEKDYQLITSPSRIVVCGYDE